jgi:DNA (cytosine-5)-methyltransferase 1
MDRPIGVDLFAGAGGMSLGFERAGFDVVAAVEIDPIHCAVHEFNFPNTSIICRSVVDLDGIEIRERAGIGTRDIDVVFGGAPCQGFSMIGKRVLDDPRNSLVQHFVRLVHELQPKFFVFENVKGLTVGPHKRFLEEIIEAFEQGGNYQVQKQYRVLNAADFGVPQDRKRLFLLGARHGITLPTYPAQRPRTNVAEAIGDLPEVENFPELANRDWTTVHFNSPSLYAQRLRGIAADPGNFSYKRKFDPNILTSSLRTLHTPLSQKRFGETPCGQTEPISRFHKLNPSGVCNTIRAGTNSDHGAFTSPRPIHPVTPRCITVREAARLHSYPDWFRFHVTKWHGFRQVGNSVPPFLAQAVAQRLIEALDIVPTQPQEAIELGKPELLAFNMAEAAQYYRVPRNTIAKRERTADRIAREHQGRLYA